jgi:hypothetical protein
MVLKRRMDSASPVTMAIVMALSLMTPLQAVDQPLPVIELFTSEGCSSCPPADRVLHSMIAHGQVVCLAFHVDYWDQLGWKDPWSSHEASLHQRSYARLLGGSLYTPCVVVNGRSHVNGADAGAIARAMAETSHEGQTMSLIASWSPTSIDASAAIDDSAGSMTVLFALVESDLSSHVTAGENVGATLTHDHVVRAFTSSVTVKGHAAAHLDVPKDLRMKNAQLIAYATTAQSLSIISAATSNPPDR